MTNMRLLVAVAAAVLLGFLTLSIVPAGNSQTAAALTPSPERQASTTLATQPDVSNADISDYYATADTASREAARLGTEIPLPQGGNFNGIRWNDLGGASRADIKGLLLFNAACQWSRARADRRGGTSAQAVLADVPRWPTLRAGDRNEFARTLSADSGPLADGVRRDCKEIHAREVTYAQSHGLAPSS